jgi:hypothetical protein
VLNPDSAAATGASNVGHKWLLLLLPLLLPQMPQYHANMPSLLTDSSTMYVSGPAYCVAMQFTFTFGGTTRSSTLARHSYADNCIGCSIGCGNHQGMQSLQLLLHTAAGIVLLDKSLPLS